MATRTGPAAAARNRGALFAYVAHLRLAFQLTLAPLFLWGFLLAGGNADASFLLAFVSLHLCLYPGVTAFNSAYDRDEGPVAGLQRPPPVPSGLLRFSLALQAAGAALAAAAGAVFLVVYLAIAAWAAAYSHPRTRWKARPWLSATVVALGQGALGFLAGWTAASGVAGIGSERAILGALGATLATFGLYPATQVYQVDEDGRRGDRTLAVALGPVRALVLGAASLAAAGAVTAWLMARAFAPLDAVLVTAAFLLPAAATARLAATIARKALTPEQIYRRASRLQMMAAAGFLAFLLYRAAAG